MAGTKRKQEHPDKLDAAEKNRLKDSDFGIPDKREFPMPDAAHVRAAEAYFRYADEKEKPELARRIMEKGKRFGVDVESQTIHAWAKK
ncbi:MAG: hypothetical protein LUD68_05095 [Rikenellaceae bacterium]|nr:hypothetical protein [Rikenellaceae bacterium]